MSRSRKLRAGQRAFFCEVISEPVTIALRRRRFGDNAQYVQCSETECQYADANLPPCPLTLAMFADEIAARANRYRADMDD